MKNGWSYLLIIVLIGFLGCAEEQSSNSTNTDAASTTPQPLEAVDFQEPFLKKYEGTIDQKLPIELILINDGDGELSGWYFYKKIGRKISLSGEVGLDESIALEEYADGKLSGRFNAKVQELSTIKGEWTDSEGQRKLDFELSEVKSDEDQTGWTGSWYLNDVWDYGLLIIGNVGKDSMDFSLNIVRNAHLGMIEGRMAKKGNKGKFKVKVIDGDDSPCDLVLMHKGDYIQLEQNSGPWACGFGMRAYAGGRYDATSKEIKPTIPYGEEGDFFQTKSEHDDFKTLVGEEVYELFGFNMQDREVKEEEELEFRILEGWVYGLMNSNKSIIVQHKGGELYAATTDEREEGAEQILYYTTAAQDVDTMIAPIRLWRESFGRLPVKYHYSKNQNSE